MTLFPVLVLLLVLVLLRRLRQLVVLLCWCELFSRGPVPMGRRQG